MKKVGITFFILSILLCFGITASAAGILSPAISVMQEEVGMIKTGIGTNTVSFTASDFENALGTTDFTAVEITSLPSVSGWRSKARRRRRNAGTGHPVCGACGAPFSSGGSRQNRDVPV